MIKTESYYRPLQYLGSKTRSISRIISECKRLYIRDGYVVDLFSGSSLVSQALYRNGMNVISNDVLSFCSDIASCMLNVNRKTDSEDKILRFLNSLNQKTLSHTQTEGFEKYIASERMFLDDKNLNGLSELYNSLPQVGKSENQSCQIKYITEHIGDSAYGHAPLIANYYAGTYFGIEQSLDLDEVRSAIEHEWILTKDEWEYKLLLTALYNTCSIIVHSAGKHFAQPIQITDFNQEKITNQRLFENRTYNVKEVFKNNVSNILETLNHASLPSTNLTVNTDICNDSFTELISKHNIEIIYADPPYTAQQYSRFYHIPEVIHSYRYPQLQIFKGRVTQGLYPDNKYKSPFCSKRMAKEAFEKIFSLTAESNAHLILSYSESKKNKTGNERMISLQDLLSLAQEKMPNYIVNQIDFSFDYRQLNSKDNIIEDKEDKEILIVFEKA